MDELLQRRDYLLSQLKFPRSYIPIASNLPPLNINESASGLGSLGIRVTKPPDFPDYANYESRLQTFTNWPTSIVQTKEQLVEAGFFYTGTGDQTTCYQCGGGLRNWEPEDDPWQQHAKWFSTCPFVRLVKGQEFINNVTGKHIQPPSEEEIMSMNLPDCIKRMSLEKCESSNDNKKELQPKLDDKEAQINAVLVHEASALVKSASSSSMNGDQEQFATTETTYKIATKPQIQPKIESRSCLNNSTQKKPIEDARVCKICYDEELSVVFLPCSHMFACIKCAPSMQVCAICKTSVTMFVRAIIS